MNFWKQANHVMSFFQEDNIRGDKRLPSSFMSGFLEVRSRMSVPWNNLY
jgi:NADH dehydrogenase (ubiquinone) 1 alpha subcomplex subunit 6